MTESRTESEITFVIENCRLLLGILHCKKKKKTDTYIVHQS